jgi:pimeloyl-ACP methyl ester carboxylesterase
MRNERVATARVVADGVATSYRRCGSGPTIVLLTREASDLEPLTQAFRVIAPELPADGPCPDWLRGVFDGLGITSAGIMCERPFVPAATAFAAQEPDRVRGVVALDETGSLTRPSG